MNQEKIDFLNRKYGVGKWHKMTKDEFVSCMLAKQEERRIAQELKE